MGGKKRRGSKQWALRGSVGPEPQLDLDSGARGQPASRVPEKLRELAVRTETSMLSTCHMPHMTREQNVVFLPSVFHPHAASISGGQRVLLRLLGCLAGAIGFFSWVTLRMRPLEAVTCSWESPTSFCRSSPSPILHILSREPPRMNSWEHENTCMS